jgi:hypothetical protein
MAETASREGNVLKAPGFSVKAEVIPAELLYSYSRLTQKGGTLVSGQGVLAAGTPLKKDSTTNMLVVDVSPGTAACRGLLRQGVDTGTVNTDLPKQCNIVTAGVVKADVVRAANAGVDLAAAALTAVAGRYDAMANNGLGVLYFGG